MAAFSTVVLLAAAGAQTYPTRPVRIIVPFPPGGGVDSVTRILAQKLTEEVGGPFVLDNRPGGAGVLGAGLAAKAVPDGYTLLPNRAFRVTTRRAGMDSMRRPARPRNSRAGVTRKCGVR